MPCNAEEPSRTAERLEGVRQDRRKTQGHREDSRGSVQKLKESHPTELRVLSSVRVREGKGTKAWRRENCGRGVQLPWRMGQTLQ